jgi:GntR family transcriptional regulator
MDIINPEKIKKDSPYPLYYQLMEKFTEKISTGQWRPGQMIPSEAELCKAFYVSRITVRKAVEELERSGLLIKRQGKGTFVTNVTMEHKLSKFYSFSEELKQSGMTERVQVLSFDVISAPEKVRDRLRLQQNEKVFALRRLRMADEMPYTVEISYMPFNICSGLTVESIIEYGLYNTMRSLNIFPERIVEKLKATAVGKADAELMKVNANLPAIELERLTYFGTEAIEYCVSTVRGDFFTYSIELVT